MIVAKNTTMPTLMPQSGQACKNEELGSAPDKVELGHSKSSGRRVFEATGSGLRTVILGAGGAALYQAGGPLQASGGLFLGTCGGLLSGYIVGRGLQDAVTAHHSQRGEAAPKWVEKAPEVSALVGAGVGLALAFTGNPVLAGSVLAGSALVGGYHIDGIQPGDSSAYRAWARQQG
jgi:hypothetical protein